MVERRRVIMLSTCVLLMAACGGAVEDQAPGTSSQGLGSPGRQPDGRQGGTRGHPPAPTPYATTGNGINYNGGPIMTGNINVYLIWYGNWSGNSATSIIPDWASNFGGSPYYNINTTYDNNSGGQVSNSTLYAGSTSDWYSRGSSLTDGDIQAIVAGAISSGHLPLDSNGVYFVLTSSDVDETSGFCFSYCGWHTYGFINGANIKYSFVGNGDRCPSGCQAQTVSPNGNAGADGMISVLSHELEETTSDPNLNAWYDFSGDENADKCAWTFGAEYTTANGSSANMRLGSRDYLIQQNWVNSGGGYCALRYVSPTTTLRYADVNGDGRSDLIYRIGTKVYVQLSNGHGFQAPTLWTVWSTAYDYRFADVNGDGKADIVGRSGTDIQHGLSNGARFLSSTAWTPWSTAYDYQLADVNGDGRADIVGRAGTDIQVGLSNGARFVGSTAWTPWSTAYDYQLADVNGDGRADIVGRSGTDIQVGLSNGARFLSSTAWTRWSTAYDYKLADVNGDGRADIVGRAGTDIQVGLSNGARFLGSTAWTSWSTAFDAQLADVSGDRKADFIGWNRAVGDLEVGLSTGSSFRASSSWGL